MITDLKPYPTYKDSGLSWLGHVPQHWETRPAFGAFVPNHERNHGMKEKTVLSLSYGRIVIKPPEKLRGLVPESFETYQVVEPGYIIIRTTDLQNDHTSLRVGMVRDRGIITSAYLALRTSVGVDPEFCFQFLNVWDSSKAIYGYGSGLRQNLDFSHFKRMPVAVPPAAEQAAIVRFVNWANGRLERTIRAKRKVIALLGEQKQAIIHRAITRGFDPSVPLKPSGIEWLGEIPAHWKVRKLKHLTRFVNGFPFKPGDWKDSGVPIIRIQNLNGSASFNYTNKKDLPAELLINRGDLMFAWSGNRGTSFGSFEWTSELPGYLNQHIFKLVGFDLPKRYFYYLLRAVTRHVEEQAGGVIGLVHVTKPELGSVQVPVAPEDEANAIAAEIDRATADVDKATSRLQREIELLCEYRTRLVADVVTGKLDVREAAALLSDKAPLDAITDDSQLADEPELADEEIEE